jgi:hypothetical protein
VTNPATGVTTAPAASSYAYDPVTGWAIDAGTGMLIDPSTGLLVDPVTWTYATPDQVNAAYAARVAAGGGYAAPGTVPAAPAPGVVPTSDPYASSIATTDAAAGAYEAAYADPYGTDPYAVDPYAEQSVDPTGYADPYAASGYTDPYSGAYVEAAGEVPAATTDAYGYPVTTDYTAAAPAESVVA